jgi:tellurite resistance protein
MPRELARQARRDRNSALVEAMVLAACADGSVSAPEIDAMLKRVKERPEFDGMALEEIRVLVSEATQRLAAAGKMEDVLAALRNRLKSHHNRLLAFGLAACVSLADRNASRTELGLLKTFQRGLGISESEVEKVITAIESGEPLTEALGEEPERLYAEVMVLVGAADGKVSREEADLMLEHFAGDPTFETVRPERAKLYVREALEALKLEGLGPRLVALAEGLSSHRQRLHAFQLASRMAKATGEAKAAETKVLDLLQVTFGLADDEVARIQKES